MKNIVETAVAAGSFNTLVKAVKEAGLVDALSGKHNLTVFAPTDEAFAKIPKDTLNSLLKDKEKLSKVLLYHVVEGKVDAESAKEAKKAKTLEGDEVKFKTKGFVNRCFAVNNSCITKADIHASNGVILTPRLLIV
jgi:uncharacterized surface protein with fasciclin (FAS1) repeats